jgi:tetratricopeptide (TPR) repeat protein
MNKEQYSIICESANHWNDWRKTNCSVRPDLSYANLDGMNLLGANLDDTNLTFSHLKNTTFIRGSAMMADFSNADLENARLQGANFSRANFSNANLKGANLTGSILKGACMVGTDLTGADCMGARFENSNLLGAVFYNAIVNGANFSGTNVQEANLYSDQFKNAIISLESVGGIEKKKKTGAQYVLLFTTICICLFLFIGIYQLIFLSESPGAFLTNVRAGLYLETGRIFDVFGKEEKAIEYLEKAIKYKPKDPRAYYILGNIYRAKKKVKESIKYFSKFLELDPTNKYAEGINSYILDHSETPKSK